MDAFENDYGVWRMNETIWEQLDLAKVNEMVEEMTSLGRYGFDDIARSLATGSMDEALYMIGASVTDVFLPGIRESKNLLLSLLVLGIFSMLLQYTFGVVKSRQVAQLAEYFVYLLVVLLLLENFGYLIKTGQEVITLTKQFMAALLPAYCLSLSLAGGAASAAAQYEFVLLLLMGIDYILAGLLLPMTQSYLFLVVMDGLDEKHRMKEFAKLLERLISWGIRICLTVTVIISGAQSSISAQLSGVQKTVFQKAVGALPGIGDLSESVTEILVGSAGLVKNSVGAAAVVVMFLLILRPVWKVLCIAFTMKLAGACLRFMGQKSLADTMSGVGEGGILVMRIVTCGCIAFCISIAMTLFVMKGG